MKLIGAGLPRTATLSQKLALEALGFAPCYHMVNVLSDLSLADKWRAMFESGGGGDWESLLGGYQATVDWPGAFFYRELLQYYPDAKVLLSTREAKAWEKSMTDTIWGVIYGDCMMRELSAARTRIDPAWDGYMELMRQMWEKSGLIPEDPMSAGEGYMANAMEAYNAEVKATVPADRLLVWTAADGWEPLCEFLEVPVPEQAFPRVNDSKMFAERIIDGALAVLTQWRAGEVAAQGA
jgi:hypothetical protein